MFLIILALIFLAFGLVVFVGAPYLPTFKKQTNTALDLLDLQPGQRLLELGCGDGRVLVAAAKRGIKATGYELNPFLAMYAWLTTRRYKGLVTVRCMNFWNASWPPTDGIYVFLLDKYMNKLDKKIIQQYSNSVNLASFSFKIPNKKHAKNSNGVYLYRY